jgi:hypothetical protein
MIKQSITVSFLLWTATFPSEWLGLLDGPLTITRLMKILLSSRKVSVGYQGWVVGVGVFSKNPFTK